MDSNTKARELLSALMDGELDQSELSELLGYLETNPELKQTWLDWHDQKSLFMGETSLHLDHDFSSSVMQQVCEEPKLRLVSSTNGQASTASQQHQAADTGRRSPFAQWGMAAGVACVMVLGGYLFSQMHAQQQLTAQQEQMNQSTETKSLEPLLPAVSLDQLAQTGLEQADQLTGESVMFQAELLEDGHLSSGDIRRNQLMVEHQGRLALTSGMGVHALARVVNMPMASPLKDDDKLKDSEKSVNSPSYLPEGR